MNCPEHDEVGSRWQQVGRDGPAQWLGALIVDALPQVKPDSGPEEMKGVFDAIRIARCRLSLAARVPQLHR
ncbi:hypothetical protein Skr01_29380 [Sphaerisporangium krabiense]|nr:hypothetical protein Skr01_29380 [Sphaerisporangium krabiense]